MGIVAKSWEKLGESWEKVGKVGKKWQKWQKWLGVAICGFMWLKVAKSGFMWLKVVYVVQSMYYLKDNT